MMNVELLELEEGARWACGRKRASSACHILLFMQPDRPNKQNKPNQPVGPVRLTLWVLNDEEERVGARKVGELAAEGANVIVGYWQASQKSEGISRAAPA
jgi:hypothetical protein